MPVLDMHDVVEFVNEYADAARDAAGEQHTAYPDAAELLTWTGPLPDVDGLVAAANAIHPVFAAGTSARERLNDRLRDLRPTPVAAVDGLRWTVDHPTDTLSAALATTVLAWLLRHGPDRLGTCRGANCVDVYADASPAGRRRFCSTTCLNRHKVAAHRRRAAGTD
ncbi:CGNR zinc finger domain-containing protein [Prauserella flava]|nr:CGNR zinc finger domain-containing protein [Prauserella flava]MCR3735602.1 CGNR zinc finger domain-containing protein [Prauserella salsuginis]